MGDRKKRNASRDPCFCVTERTENNNDGAGHPSDPSGLGPRGLCHRLRGRPSEARAARLGESEEQGERKGRVRESESESGSQGQGYKGESQSEGQGQEVEGQGQDEGRWLEGQGQGLEQEEIQVQEEQKREESEELLSRFSRLPACARACPPACVFFPPAYPGLRVPNKLLVMHGVCCPK